MFKLIKSLFSNKNNTYLRPKEQTDREVFESIKQHRKHYNSTPDCWYCKKKWDCESSCTFLGYNSKICDNFKWF